MTTHSGHKKEYIQQRRRKIKSNEKYEKMQQNKKYHKNMSQKNKISEKDDMPQYIKCHKG